MIIDLNNNDIIQSIEGLEHYTSCVHHVNGILGIIVTDSINCLLNLFGNGMIPKDIHKIIIYGHIMSNIVKDELKLFIPTLLSLRKLKMYDIVLYTPIDYKDIVHDLPCTVEYIYYAKDIPELGWVIHNHDRWFEEATVVVTRDKNDDRFKYELVPIFDKWAHLYVESRNYNRKI